MKEYKPYSSRGGRYGIRPVQLRLRRVYKVLLSNLYTVGTLLFMAVTS